MKKTPRKWINNFPRLLFITKPEEKVVQVNVMTSFTIDDMVCLLWLLQLDSYYNNASIKIFLLFRINHRLVSGNLETKHWSCMCLRHCTNTAPVKLLKCKAPRNHVTLKIKFKQYNISSMWFITRCAPVNKFTIDVLKWRRKDWQKHIPSVQECLGLIKWIQLIHMWVIFDSNAHIFKDLPYSYSKAALFRLGYFLYIFSVKNR